MCFAYVKKMGEYYTKTHGVNINDGYVNGVALWTYLVTVQSKDFIQSHLRDMLVEYLTSLYFDNRISLQLNEILIFNGARNY